MEVLNKYMNLKKYFLFIYLFSFLIIICLTMLNKYLALISFIIYLILTIVTIRSFKLMKKRLQEHEKEMFTQIEKASNRINENMPIGVIIYTEDNVIEWANSYMAKIYQHKTMIGQSILDIFDGNLNQVMRLMKKETWLHVEKYYFKVWIDHDNRMLYFFNRTDEYEIKQTYEREQIVLANIYLDNYDEITRNMEDDVRSQINSEVTTTLNKWAEAHQFYIKRISQDRFLAVLTKEILQRLEESRFHILDEIRTIHLDKIKRTPITLSVGIGSGDVTILELSKLAQSSLDLVLGRGGDQVAIKDDLGKVRFYGGKTNPIEKRTKVRARVISQALIELIKNSDQVFIMGHRSPDMDSLGSSIGVLHIVKSVNKTGYVIFDKNDMTLNVSKVYEKITLENELSHHFIDPDRADELLTENSLIIIVDTHRPSLTISENALQRTSQKAIIDHHRRGEEFIEDATLVYMEPYASSTAELVTELIEYTPSKKQLTSLEATILLAGIIVDTQSFSFRTGSRTFDAASYLRIKGADPLVVQQFLKEDLQSYKRRNKLIELAYLYHDKIAIVKAPDDEKYDSITIAQTADTLLTIEHVMASFVIAHTDENIISVSARSFGDMNVQIMMEQMNGGGHLTNAATQIVNMSIDEVEKEVIHQIEQYFGTDAS